MVFFTRYFIVALPSALVLVWSIVWSSIVNADWVNLTGAETAQNIAEIYVLDDHVKVKLEVYVGNYDKFEELVPDELLQNSYSAAIDDDRPSLHQRMQTFADQRLQFITEDGTKLSAKLVLVESRTRIDRKSVYAGKLNPYTKKIIQTAPADKRVLYAEIIYPFSKKPQQLTIIPPLNQRGKVELSLGFIAFHKSVPIVDFRFLGSAAKLNLDWQDPWFTKFESRSLSRHHSYPLMLYLYVEPRIVRLESLMRINDITQWSNFTIDDSALSLEEKHYRLREHIRKYFMSTGELQIDGEARIVDVVSVEFLKVALSGLSVIDDITKVDPATTLVGVSQQYYVTALPQNINTRWRLFNQRVSSIPVTVTDPAGPLNGLVDKLNPDVSWQNFLKTYQEPTIIPVDIETGFSLSLPYIGETKIINALPDEEQAQEIISAVLENVRVAFVEKQDDDFMRVLGKAISSTQAITVKKELEKLYSPQVKGGVGSVQTFNDVQIHNIRKLKSLGSLPDGFSATISGSAIIKAQHWGHVDQRQVDFQLLLDLIEDNNQWKLSDLTVIDLK